MRFFHSLNRDPVHQSLSIHRRFCSAMRYLRVAEGQVVFREGDPSDYMYILLSGAVNVFIAKKSEQIAKEKLWMEDLVSKVQQSHQSESSSRRLGCLLRTDVRV